MSNLVNIRVKGFVFVHNWKGIGSLEPFLLELGRHCDMALLPLETNFLKLEPVSKLCCPV